VISFFRAVAVVVFVISSSLGQLAYAQEACVTSGDSLKQAKDNFASQCNVARVDCDPFDGVWFCASFKMKSSSPPALTSVPSSPPLTPVVQAPAPTPVVVVQPAPINPAPTSQPPIAQLPQPPIPAPQPPVTQPVVMQPVVAPQPPSAAPALRPACARTDSDSDGDGFGWENGTTCLVVASVTQPAPTVAQPVVTPPERQLAAASPTTRPTCARTDSDSDGDGFGWENGTTCLVMASVAQPAPTVTQPVVTQPVATPPERQLAAASPATRPTCARTDSDSDGDGFGWENETTCLVAARSIPAPPSSTAPIPSTPPVSNVVNNLVNASDITDLILVTGQSNALGAGTGFDPVLDAPNNRVFAFTNNGWRKADLHQVWDRRWFPRNDPATDPSNNFSLHFGKSIAARNTNRVVGFILVTAPGAAIAEWNFGSSFYNTIETKVLDAINQLPHKSAVDGILWHQGESDGQDKPYYTNALYSLISNLRNEPWIKPRAPFICGETKVAAINNRLNSLNSDSDPNTACVKGIDLSTLGDNRHFDAAALRTLGVRYADAYLRITR